MKYWSFNLTVIMILGMMPSTSAQEVVNGSIQHDGIERQYILYIPASFEAGNPLVMNFHGYGSNATQQMAYGDFRPIADEEGFLIVHPEGTEDLTGTAHWNVGWGTSSVDDVDFIYALTEHLNSEYSIDLDRIYSTGMSNGGFFSYQLACQLSERIAAIASVTGSMTSGTFANCNALHAMPVMEIHGTADPTVPYGGNFLFEGTEDVVEYWADFNGIVDPPLINAVPDIDPSDGCTAERWLYENGNDGVEVEHYKVFDGGHTWPGAIFPIGTTNQDFDASEVIWEFFSKFDINGALIPVGVEEIESISEISLWPNPCQDQLNIQRDGSPVSYSIFDAQGQLVKQGTLDHGENSIALDGIDSGFYQLYLADGTNRSFVVENPR